MKEAKNFLNLPKNWHLKKNSKGVFELHTDKGGPFSVRFSSTPPLSRQPLVKALGFKGKSLTVWDVTAGWGKDAYLLACLGCQVRAIEKEELVFFLLTEGLRHSLPLKKGSLQFIHENSINYLNNASEKPDIIYMDPLFGKEKKSLSTKPLRILQALIREEKNETETLFRKSLKTADKRVIVKRHRLQPSFEGPLRCSFAGRTVCYDVFFP